MKAHKIHETIDFKRGQDPHKALGIGGHRSGKLDDLEKAIHELWDFYFEDRAGIDYGDSTLYAILSIQEPMAPENHVFWKDLYNMIDEAGFDYEVDYDTSRNPEDPEEISVLIMHKN